MAGTDGCDPMIRALYVDDEKVLLDLGKRFLERSGTITLDIAGSARDAIQKLKDGLYDVIVSDYQMPVMDGIAFLKYLQGKCDDIPFILFTGKGREEVAIEALNNGAEFYIQKGGDPLSQFVELEHKIKQAVARRRSEQKVRYFNRLYAILSGVNSAIVRIDDEQDLFSEVCRIAVDEGGFRMAWIGLADPETDELRPVAFAGFEEDYLRTVRISTADVPEGQGPSGRAVREKAHVVCNRIDTDPKMALWHSETKKRGYRSTGAFPIFRKDKVIGTLQLYTAEPDFFSNDEIALLDEIASDLSFALEKVEAEKQRKRAEKEIRRKNEELEKAYLEIGEAQKKLLESEEKYRTVVEKANEAILIAQDGKFVFVNQRMAGIFGVPVEQLTGTSFIPLIHPDDRGMVMQRYEARISGDSIADGYDFRVIGKGQEVRWVSISAARILWEGRPATINLMTDITERKAAEEEAQKKTSDLEAAYEEIIATDEELRASYDNLQASQEQLRGHEQKLAAIIDFLPDATFAIDTAGKVIAWNRAIEEMTGVPASEMLGKGAFEYAYTVYHDRHPILIDIALGRNEKDAHPYREIIRERDRLIAQTYSPFLGGENGVHLWLTASRLYDRSGNLLGAIESIRDITRLKETEKALARSEEQYRAVIENIQDVFYRSDRDGVLVMASPSWAGLLGYDSLEECLGSGIAEVFYYEPEKRSEFLQTIMEMGIVENYEVVLKTKDGRPVPVSTNSHLYYDEEGSVLGVEGIFRDIRKLKEAEDQLRLILNSISDGILVISTDGIIQVVNDAVCSLLRYKPGDLIGHPHTILHEPAGVPVAREMMRTILAEGKGLFETVHVTRDGQAIPVELNVRVVPFNGQPSFFAVQRDITERKKSEAALRESEERLADIVEHLPDPTFVIDEHGVVLAWNRAMESLTGVRAGEMVGRGEYEYSLPFYQERRPILIDLSRQPDPVFAGKYSYIHAEGRTLVAEALAARVKGEEVILWGKATPLLDREGRIAGAIETVRDVTAIKKAEETLRETHDYLENLIRYANAPIIVWNREGVITRFNHAAEELTGIPEMDAVGLPVSLLFSEEDRECAMGRIRKNLTEEDWRSVEVPFMNWITGSQRTVLISATNLLDTTGTSVVATIAQGQDITDRKNAEGALIHVNRQLNLLSSITRHDILNKISAQFGAIELARDSCKTNPELDSYLDRIEAGAVAIRNQIEFTRVYQDLGSHHPIWQDIRKKFPVHLVPKGIRFECRCGEIEVYADPMLQKVFSNLLDNTLRHGGNVTCIRLFTRPDGPNLCISYEDNGTGILWDEKEKIFERGYGKNTGLGLFLVREILAITGMTIRECGEPRKGVRFEILVPKGIFR